MVEQFLRQRAVSIRMLMAAALTVLVVIVLVCGCAAASVRAASGHSSSDEESFAQTGAEVLNNERKAALAAQLRGRESIAAGRMEVPCVYHQGAFFNQFSWCPDIRDRQKNVPVLDSKNQTICRVRGELVDPPHEMIFKSISRGGGAIWAVVCGIRPLKLDTNLRKFGIFSAQRRLFAEVREQSDVKCVVNDASGQRSMLVIGNFGDVDFLRGKRVIRIWSSGFNGTSMVTAQCECCVDAYGGGAEERKSFYVSTKADNDAPLIMAAMMGIYELQTKRPSVRSPIQEKDDDDEEAAGLALEGGHTADDEGEATETVTTYTDGGDSQLGRAQSPPPTPMSRSRRGGQA